MKKIVISADKCQFGMYGLFSSNMDSESAACILCGSKRPTGVAICGITPVAVTPTNTNLFFTSISCNVVCGVSTQLIHCLPYLSSLVGGIPLTAISSMPASEPLIIYVSC